MTGFRGFRGFCLADLCARPPGRVTPGLIPDVATLLVGHPTPRYCRHMKLGVAIVPALFLLAACDHRTPSGDDGADGGDDGGELREPCEHEQRELGPTEPGHNGDAPAVTVAPLAGDYEASMFWDGDHDPGNGETETIVEVGDAEGFTQIQVNVAAPTSFSESLVTYDDLDDEIICYQSLNGHGLLTVLTGDGVLDWSGEYDAAVITESVEGAVFPDAELVGRIGAAVQLDKAPTVVEPQGWVASRELQLSVSVYPDRTEGKLIGSLSDPASDETRFVILGRWDEG